MLLQAVINLRPFRLNVSTAETLLTACRGTTTAWVLGMTKYEVNVLVHNVL